jgi:hypothetical protein
MMGLPIKCLLPRKCCVRNFLMRVVGVLMVVTGLPLRKDCGTSDEIGGLQIVGFEGRSRD